MSGYKADIELIGTSYSSGNIDEKTQAWINLDGNMINLCVGELIFELHRKPRQNKEDGDKIKKLEQDAIDYAGANE